MTGKGDAGKKENIFDLTKLVSMENEEELKKESTEITSSDQDKLLENYIEVASSDWDKIPKNTHIRYMRKDGNFRKGGFVKASWISSYGKDKGKKSLQLASNMSYKATKWTIVLDEVDRIWKKNITSNISSNTSNTSNISNGGDTDAVAGLQNQVKTNTELIEHLTKVVENLKIDNARLANDQTRTLNLIKKIYPIIKRPTQ